jgi:hypothetical protein
MLNDMDGKGYDVKQVSSWNENATGAITLIIFTKRE